MSFEIKNVSALLPLKEGSLPKVTRASRTTEAWNKLFAETTQDKYVLLSDPPKVRPEKSVFLCREHGEYEQNLYYARQHPTRGCPGCQVPQRTRQLTLEQYKERIAERYPHFTFVRPAGEWAGRKTPAVLSCPIHGEFVTNPLRTTKSVCRQCMLDENKSKGLARIKQRTLELFGDKITIVDDTYVDTSCSVDVICKHHGRSTIRASTIMFNSEGREIFGCVACANEAHAQYRMLSFEDFVQEAQKIHGDSVEYVNENWAGANGKITYICSKHGKVESSVYNYLQSPYSCKECMLESAYKVNSIPWEEFLSRARAVHGDTYEYVEGSYTEISGPVTIVCKQHGEFTTKAVYHTHSESGCPSCGVKVSKGEREVLEFVKSLGVKVEGSYKYQSNREFDIFLPEHNLAIEYDGLLWHSTKFRDRATQLRKARDAKDLDVELIRIFEDEWVHRQEQVKSLLRMRIGVENSERVFARKCEIREVENTTARNFYDENHIQGWNRYGTNLGLFHQDKLVALMTFTSTLSSRKKAKAGEVELARYATNAQVVGGASKLLKAYIREYAPKLVVSYSDKRMFSGEMYNKLGFSNVADIPPSYTYFNDKRDSLTRHHKSKFQRQHLQRLLGDAFNPEMTEKENAELAGYYQIYDDGKIRWELKL